MNKAADLLRQTQELASSVQSWADLSNALYDPAHGILTTAYSTRAEREAFAQTSEFKCIRELLEKARDRFGLVEGAIPMKPTRMVVNVPLSLQVALEQEAFAKGVSVDQLVLAKLAGQMNTLAGV